MKFVSKTPWTLNGYWVEDYTPEERVKLIEFGFVETIATPQQKMFKIKDTLHYVGSDAFTMWNKEEHKAITLFLTELNGKGYRVHQAIND